MCLKPMTHPMEWHLYRSFQAPIARIAWQQSLGQAQNKSQESDNQQPKMCMGARASDFGVCQYLPPGSQAGQGCRLCLLCLLQVPASLLKDLGPAGNLVLQVSIRCSLC